MKLTNVIHAATQSSIILLIFACCFLIAYVNRRLSKKAIEYAVSILMVALSVAYVFLNHPGSVFISYFALSLVMVSAVWILKFITFTVLEYALFFSIFILSMRLFDASELLYGKVLLFIIVFVAILAVSKIKLGTINGNVFNIWFSIVITAMDGYLFSYLFGRLIRNIGYRFDSPHTKVLLWFISTVIAVCLNIAVIMAVKRVFKDYFSEINLMSKTYAAIERYFLYISVGILLFLMLINVAYVLRNDYNSVVDNILFVVCVASFVLQLLYLTLLFRVAYLKDNLSYKELENQSLMLYSAKFEETYDTFRNIKHDIKNIFFTMGQFVEKSNDKEMQEFYRSKIAAFAATEIKKGDLYGKLICISNEPLKAFLYYKISQAMERDISVELEISTTAKNYLIAMDFVDLIRVLGILLDNSIEECLNTPCGMIEIKISQNNDISSYTIKNSITAERKEIGVKAGQSTKGENRGNGLTIVQTILGKYDFVTLNSYFKEDFFVQNLNIYLSGEH